jgi:hypothetical protein
VLLSLYATTETMALENIYFVFNLCITHLLYAMLVYLKYSFVKNGGVSYLCWIFVNNNLSVSLNGAIIITPSSSEVNTETRQYKTY